MYQLINRTDFHDAFHKMGRKDTFTYEGLNALYDYLESESPDAPGHELDVIALCCDYHETTIEEAKKDCDLEDMSDEEALQYLRDNTIVASEEPLIYVGF